MNKLNISTNTKLSILDCSNNSIQTLNILQNKEISSITCNNNDTTTLNVSSLRKLVFLDILSNQLCVLNIKNGANNSILPVNFNFKSNPKLSCIIVDNANHSGINWNNIDTNSNFISSQEECQTLGYISIPIDKLEDTVQCSFFILPKLTNGNYYTESDGLGDLLIEGDEISTSKKIYIYTENNYGSNESSFNVIIHKNSSLDTFKDVTVCGPYTLTILEKEKYYTESAGQGILLNHGNLITVSQRIFIYIGAKIDHECPDEIGFNITIHPLFDFELSSDQIEIQRQSIMVTSNN